MLYFSPSYSYFEFKELVALPKKHRNVFVPDRSIVPRPLVVWRTRHCSLFAFCVEDERTKLRRVTLTSWKSEFTYSVYCRSILSGVGIVNEQLVGGLEVILK